MLFLMRLLLNRLIRLLLLHILLFVTALSTTIIAEEADISDALWELIAALPDNPTTDEELSFYKSLRQFTTARLVFPEDLKGGIPNVFAGMLGYSCGERIVKEVIYRPTSEEDMANCKFSAVPSWKPGLIEIALTKIVLEKLAELPTKDAKRCLKYIKGALRFFGLRESEEYSFHYDTRTADQFRRRLAEAQKIEAEYRIFAKQDEDIEREVERLVDAYGKGMSFEVWLKLIKDTDDEVQLSSLLLMYFRFADPATALLPQVEDYSLYKGETIFETAKRLIKPEYLISGEHQDMSRIAKTAPNEVRALLLPQIMALDSLFTKDDRWQWRKESLLYFMCDNLLRMSFYGFESCLHSDFIKVVNKYKTCISNRSMRQTESNSYFSMALKEVERGKLEDAWLLGATGIKGNGNKEISSDFIYPIVEVFTTPEYDPQYYSLLRRNEFLPCVLDRTGYFYWRRSIYFRWDEEGDRTKTYSFKPIELTFEYSDKRIAESLKNGDFLKWATGCVGLNIGALNVQSVKELFTPAVWYHFAKVQWRIMQLQQFDFETGMFMYDTPNMVLIIEPVEGEYPIEVVAGYIYKANWLFNNGIRHTFGQHWSANELRTRDDYLSIRKQASDVIANEEQTYRERMIQGNKRLNVVKERLLGIPMQREE